MLTNTIKLSLRTLLRDKLYCSINVIGIALAVATCLILGLYLYRELSFDRYHVNHPRIYRVANAFQDYDTGNQRRALALTSPALGPLLAKDFPEIAAFVRVQPERGDVLLRHDERQYYWQQVFNADAGIFKMFTHKILYGDAATALTDPSSVAISAKVAKAYFGDKNPLGETLLLDKGEAKKVTLVFDDLPENTHLKYDVLFSYSDTTLAEADAARALFGVNTYTYLLMPANYDPAAFGAISTAFFHRYMETLSRERTNRAWSGWLQPLTSIHLGETLLNDEPAGSRYYLYGFGSVAVFILLIAAINYMNLATAGFTRRARQVGIRKIFGESRLALILQFLAETVVLVLASLFLGSLVVELTITDTPLSALVGKLQSLNFGQQPLLLVALLGGGLLFAALAGLYPAFYLSSFRPLAALAGKRTSRSSNSELRLREGLLLLQFTIAIGVIACTLFMALQMRLLASQPLGFDKNNQLLLTLRDPALVAQIPAIEQQLKQHAGILGVSQTTSIMGQEVAVNSTAVQTNAGNTEPVQMGHMAVDANFVDVLGMHLVAGRNFSDEISTDAASAVLVNAALVKYMKWEEPLGKTLRSTWGKTATVVGVVEDFNFRSLHTAVEPFFLYQPGFSTPGRLGAARLLVIKVNSQHLDTTLAFIEKTLKAFGSHQPFEYHFLNDELDGLYLSEQRLMLLIGIFSVICMAVTCLGLFGLTTFTTEQRTKEIGIRRVLGASRVQIVLMLFNKTLLLGLAGAALAALIVYPVMDAWLANFAYRIALTPAVFAVAALAVLAVAFATMAAQTIRVAGIAPVKTMRYE